MLYEKGETLIPHEDFLMNADGFDDERERVLTKGLSYIIIDINKPDTRDHEDDVMYLFIDDQQDEHYMGDDEIAGWTLQP